MDKKIRSKMFKYWYPEDLSVKDKTNHWEAGGMRQPPLPMGQWNNSGLGVLAIRKSGRISGCFYLLRGSLFIFSICQEASTGSGQGARELLPFIPPPLLFFSS